MEVRLFCNSERCQQVSLETTAWITSCSHIFCDKHFPRNNTEKDRKCPLCTSDLSGGNDLFQINLDVPDEYFVMVLAGLSPKVILEICYKAFTFWMYQKHYKIMYLSSTVKHLHNKLAQLQFNYRATTVKLKELIVKETQKCEELKNELNSYIQKTKDLEEKVYIKNTQLYNLQMSYESLHRQQTEQSRMSQHTNETKNLGCSANSFYFFSQTEKTGVNRNHGSQQRTTSKIPFKFNPK